jgi:hypothetical protein
VLFVLKEHDSIAGRPGEMLLKQATAVHSENLSFLAGVVFIRFYEGLPGKSGQRLDQN